MKYLCTASWVGFFTLGLTLRLVWLGEVPSPAGDERNSGLLGLRLSQGLPAQLTAEEAFIPRTFGHLIALMFCVFGESFWAARLVSVLLPILLMVAVFIVCRRNELQVLGWVVTLLFLFLPWPVMWARSIACPYASNLPLAILGPLCWLLALDIPGKWRQALGLVAAGQILVFGMHFSPLAVIPLLACCLWTLCARFTTLKRPGPWLAAAAILIHAWPLLMLIWQSSAPSARLAEKLHGLAKASGDSYDTFPKQLERYALVLTDMCSGESTVRYFTNGAVTDGTLAGLRLLTALGAMLAFFLGAKETKNAALPLAREPAGLARQLACFSAWHLVLGMVLLAVMLSRARIWSLVAIYDDRYAFVVLAPLFLLLGALALFRPKVRWCLPVAIVLFGLLPTGRILWRLTEGGGPSLGVFNLDGGGWHGLRVIRGPESVPEHLWGVLEREAAREPIHILGGDKFSVDAIEFFIERSRRTDIQHVWIWEDRPQNPHWPILRPGQRLLLASWADELFTPDFRPGMVPFLNKSIRESFQANFEEVQLLEKLVQPDGSPLMELWLGRMPVAKK